MFLYFPILSLVLVFSLQSAHVDVVHSSALDPLISDPDPV